MESAKWILNHGIHRGTVTSRDSGTSTFDTEQEARDSFLEQKEWYRSIGYVIWFAYLTSPDGKKIVLDSGNNAYF